MKAKWLSLVCVFCLLVIVACSAFGQVPRTISYQGRLTNDIGAPLTGTPSITFRLYDVATGGTALWSETHPGVAVQDGLFTVLLGSLATLPGNIFDSPSRWLGITISSGLEMTPRQPITSSAFAFRSGIATTVDDGAITAAKLANDPGSLARVSGGALSAFVSEPGEGGFSFQTGNTSSFPVTWMGMVTPTASTSGKKYFFTWYATSDTPFLLPPRSLTLWQDSVGAAYGPLVSFGIDDSEARYTDINGKLSVGSTAYFADRVGVGTRSPEAKLQVPYVGEGADNNAVLIGSLSDMGGGNHELSIALPAGAGHWPFGIMKGGQRLLAVTPFGDIEMNNGNKLSFGGWGNGTQIWDDTDRTAILAKGNKLDIVTQDNGAYIGSFRPDSAEFPGQLTVRGGVINGIGRLHIQADEDLYLNPWRGGSVVVGGGGGPGRLSCGTLTLTSSRRFKDDVEPIENPLDSISKLQGVSYNWDEEHGGKRDIGFIAEDVAKVLPELVTMEADGKNAVGMDYTHLIALAIEGIKAQQKEIEALKSQNMQKDNAITELLTRLERLEMTHSAQEAVQ